MVPLHQIIRKGVVFEVVEEGCEPIAFFNDVGRDGVEFILLWDELHEGEEKPSLFDSDLWSFPFRKEKCCNKFHQGIG